MKDKNKTQKQPTKELTQLRRRIAELETSGRKRNQFEEALRQSEEKYRTILENIEDGYYEVDLAGNFTFLNDSMCRIQGYPSDELMGMNNRDYMDKETAKKVYKIFNTVLRTGKSATISDWQIIRKGGSLRDVESSVSLIRDANRNPVGFRGVIRDITERKRAEEILRAERDKAKQYLDIVEVILVVLNKKGKITLINRKGNQILGYKEGELLGKNWFTTCLPSHLRKKMKGGFLKLMAGEREISEFYETPALTKSGAERIIAWHNTVLKDAAGNIIGTLSSGEDITERKKAEDRLKESEAKYRSLVENSLEGITQSKGDRLFFANRALLNMTGYETAEEFLHVSLLEHTAPESKDLIQGILKKQQNGETVPARLSFKIVRKDGDIRSLEASFAETLVEGETWVQGTFRDVTERKQAEDALQESEERFRLAFENANTGVCLVDLEGNLARVNSKMCEIFGYTKEELERMTVNDIAHPADIDKNPEFIQKTLQGEINRATFEKRYIHKKGHVVTCEVSSSLVRNAEGAPLYFISHVHDITDRKRLEENLEKEREDLKLIIDSSPIIVFYKDNEGRFKRVNKTFAEALKMPEGDFVGKTVFDLYSSQIAQGMTDDDKEVFQSQRPKLSIIEKYESSSGIRWVQTDKIPIFDKHGLPIGLIGFAQDITDSKQAEEQIRESQQRFQGLVETLSDWIWEVDQSGIYTYVSPKIRDLLGYEPAEVLGKTPFDLMPPEEAERVKVFFESLVAAQQPIVALENTNRHKDGRLIVFETSAAPFFNVEGQFMGYRGVDRDITARKQVEEALRERQETINAIIETSQDWIWAIDRHGVHTYSNPAIEKILGYWIGEIVGSLSLNLIHEDDKKIVESILQECQEKRCGWNNLLLRWRHKNGTYRYLESNAVPILDSKGDLVGFRGVDRDITERKQAEEALRQSEERMKSIFRVAPIGIGVVANRIIMDVNTRMCEMTGYSREELVGSSARLLYPTQDDFEYVGREKYRQIDEKGTGSVETRWMKNDGTIIDVLLSSTPIDLSDQSRGVTFTAMDITERKQAEMSLRDSEEKYRDLVENINDILYATDDHGIVTYIAPAIESLSGYAISEVIGRSFFDFIYEEDIPYMRGKFQQDISGQIEPHEYRMVNKAGDVRWVRTSSRPLFRETRFVGFRGTMNDITARKQAEEEVKRGYEQLQETLHATVRALASTVEMKDQYTAGHQPRVTQLACAIAEEMGFLQSRSRAFACPPPSTISARSWSLPKSSTNPAR